MGRWDEVRQLHASAAAELADTAAAIPSNRWLEPRHPGKWSPAEIVEHLTLAYDTLLREIDGGGGMQIRTKLWQRVLLRLTLVPRLLRGAPFPANARAPRETRPSVSDPDQSAAVARFRERAAKLEASADSAVASRRRVRLTHAYFGSSALPEAMLLCARHVQHHQKQLAESERA